MSSDQSHSMAEKKIALIGGTVIDGKCQAPLEDAVVLIEGNRIARVGRRGEVEYPDTTEEIDLSGKFLLPGLIDVHVHYDGWMGEMFLAHGVTTVKDMGNDIEWMSKISGDIEQGEMRGPRIFYVGNGLDAPPPVREHHVGLNSPAEARRAVEVLHSRGASAIKVREKITPELLRAISDRAHDLGIPVTGHIKNIDAREAAAAGIDGLEHATGIVEATADVPRESHAGLNEVEAFIEELKEYSLIDSPKARGLVKSLAEKNVALIPTMANFWRMGSERCDQFAREDAKYANNQSLAYVPEYVRKLWETSFIFNLKTDEDRRQMQLAYKKVRDLVMQHYKAGGRVLAGSDTFFSVPGLSLQRELLFFVDTGFTPMEAISIATRANAEFIGRGDELGTIAPGKLADIIAVSESPVDDISNIGKVAMVIKNGDVQDIDYHADYSIPSPKPKLARPLWIEKEIRA